MKTKVIIRREHVSQAQWQKYLVTHVLASSDDADASVGGGGGGNDKEAGVVVVVLCCANCGTDKTPLWRKDAAGNDVCNTCGEYILLLPNFHLSFFSLLFYFHFVLFLFSLRFGCGTGGLVFISWKGFGRPQPFFLSPGIG